MTRALASRCMAVAIVLLQALCATSVSAQQPPALAPVPKSCETPGTAAIAGSQLPRVAAALRDRKTIRILAIGGASVPAGGRASSGPYGVLERFLESTFKGLDVVIIDRGVSGELAADAAERIRTEVGLDDADLVLWQLGTADAMAGVSTDDLRRVISETASWLKEHNVDLIMIGLRYSAQLAGDPHYQDVRRSIREVASELGIMRFGRYEAEETFERIRREKGQDLSEVEATDASYVCMAEYLARAIAAGLFGRQSPPRPAGAKPPAAGPPATPQGSDAGRPEPRQEPDPKPESR